MKKLIPVFLAVGLLCACGRGTESSSVAEPIVLTDNDVVSGVAYEPFSMIQPRTMGLYGSGNSQGFYEVLPNEDTSKNVFYTDYEAARQVYLCAQPNCEHNSDACTSWVAPTNADVRVAPTENELFWIFSNEGGQSRIERSDLTGENRSLVYEFPSNVDLAYGVAYNGEYLAVFGTTYIDQTDGAVSVQPALYLVNVDSGDCAPVYLLEASTALAYEPGNTSMFFFGVTDTGFVLKTITAGSGEVIDENGNPHEENPTRHVLYELPFDGGELRTLLAFDQDTCYEELYDGKLYYLEDNGDGHYSLNCVSGPDGAKTVLIEDFSAYGDQTEIPACPFTDLYLEAAFDDYIVIKAMTHSGYDEDRNIVVIFKNYAVNLQDKSITPLTLSNYYNATEVPLEILADLGDKLFVVAQVEESKDPASQAIAMSREYHMGLISKEDYLSSTPNYTFIDATRYRN